MKYRLLILLIALFIPIALTLPSCVTEGNVDIDYDDTEGKDNYEAPNTQDENQNTDDCSVYESACDFSEGSCVMVLEENDEEECHERCGEFQTQERYSSVLIDQEHCVCCS